MMDVTREEMAEYDEDAGELEAQLQETVPLLEWHVERSAERALANANYLIPLADFRVKATTTVGGELLHVETMILRDYTLSSIVGWAASNIATAIGQAIVKWKPGQMPKDAWHLSKRMDNYPAYVRQGKGSLLYGVEVAAMSEEERFAVIGWLSEQMQLYLQEKIAREDGDVTIS